MTRVFLGVAALVVAGVSGCAAPAHYVTRDRQSGAGVVAIPDNSDVWPTYNYRSAIALIEQDTGPNNYEILTEGQVVKGQATNTNRQVNSQQTANGDVKTVNNMTTTSAITEWQITYRRKSPSSRSQTVLPGSGGGTPMGGIMQGQPGGGGVQQTGGIVPNVGPAGGNLPAGGGMQPAGGYPQYGR